MAMANKTRKALVFCILLLLDQSNAGIVRPSRISSRTDNEHLGHNGTSPDLLALDDSLAPLRDSLTSVLPASAFSAFSCDDQTEAEVFQHLKGVPVAEELYTLMSTVMLQLNGCQDQANARLLEFQQEVAAHPASAHMTLDLLEAIQDEQDEAWDELIRANVSSVPAKDALRRALAHDIQDGALGNATNAIRILETLDEEQNTNQTEKVKESIENAVSSHNDQLRKRRWTTEVQVSLYDRTGFSGSHTTLTGSDLTIPSSWKQRISSISVPKNHSIFLFEEEGFVGRQKGLFESQRDVKHLVQHQIGSMVTISGDFRQICYQLFRHRDFGGSSEKFCGDLSSLPDRWTGRVSSIKVPSDASLVLYQGTFVGRFKWVSGNVDYIGDAMNDKVSSIQVRPWSLSDQEGYIEPKTVFYEHRSYSGRQVSLGVATEYIGDELNDMVTSIRCEGQCSLMLFEHRDFGGESRLYQGSQTELDRAMNDKISSAMVLTDPICVVLYEHRDFAGSSIRICEDVDNLVEWDWNDKVSSLKVECPEGKTCSVLVYQHRQFEGDHKSFHGEVSWVGDPWNDMITSIQIRPWKMEVESKASCVNPSEQKAHNVIQWIPILSFFYDLSTSIYYGAIGCHEVAKERAIDMAIGFAMDAAIIVTGGAAGVAVFGAKAGAKAGIKAGLTAAKEAIVASVKSAVQKSLSKLTSVASKGLVGNVKSIATNAITNVRGASKAIKSLPQAGKNVAEKIAFGVKNGVDNGFVDSTKKVFKNAGQAVKDKIDDVAENMQKKVDDMASRRSSKVGTKADDVDGLVEDVSTNGKKNSDGVDLAASCRVKRGAVGAPQDCVKRQIGAMNRATLSSGRRERAERFFDDVLSVPDTEHFMYKGSGSKSILTIPYKVVDDVDVKQVLQNLQYYHDFIPKGGRLIDSTGKEISSQFGLQVKMKIGDRPFEFVMSPSDADRQIFISFSKKKNPRPSHTYTDIAEQLDGSVEKTKMHAKVIQEALDAKTGQKSDWKGMTDYEIEAAQELIVLTQVAEAAIPDSKALMNVLSTNIKQRSPKLAGGVAGMDKVARGYIRKIADGDATFKSVFNKQSGEFVIARGDGKRQIKHGYFRSDSVNKETRKSFDREQMLMSDSSIENVLIDGVPLP